MRQPLLMVLVGAGLASHAIPAESQVQVVMDLAQEDEGGSTSMPRPITNDLRLTIANRLPGSNHRYMVSVVIEQTVIPPLSLPAMSGQVPNTQRNFQGPGGNRVEEVCPADIAKKLDDA